MDEPTLFDHDVDTHRRSSDPDTSRLGAQHAAFRANTHKHLLLDAYRLGRHLTDEEAAAGAGLAHTGYWKRCSDLRNDGFIEPVGATRIGTSGTPQMLCVITPAGQRALQAVA